jgi:hypothetical protein
VSLLAAFLNVESLRIDVDPRSLGLLFRMLRILLFLARMIFYSRCRGCPLPAVFVFFALDGPLVRPVFLVVPNALG